MADFKKIQAKWQKKWAEKKVFKVKEDPKMPKYYCLEMFPYPSGSGLHMGHAFNYSIGDSYARFKRMSGFNVLYPMGYDSFGLPAENAAIKAKIHPRKHTEKTIKRFIEQQKELGLSYDWDRMLSTCEPEYYKWNQYFFLKFMEKGLVYRKEAPVNWCPKCKTVLANEQVHDGKCWRHEDTEVDQKMLEQWFIKTTEYADELFEDIPKLQWPDRIKTMQKNWIGKSHGLMEEWPVEGMNLKLKTFTTEPHTTYGASFMVLAPEHPLVLELVKGTKYEKEAKNFIKKCKRFRIEDPTNTEKQKEGFFIGKYVLNHLNRRKMPLYIANFAIMDYGTGIVKCTPTHDQRDYEFAKKYDLGFYPVIEPPNEKLDPKKMKQAYTDLTVGKMVDAGKFTGMDAKEAKIAVADYTVKIGHGEKTVNYKLRDWLVSRQRYWGTPIPVIHCAKCGLVPVSEKDLPILLPEKVKFGEGNPLLSSKEFVEVKCPTCKGDARRETDTMDTFYDSSWYFLRYCDNKNKKAPFDKKKVKYWMPVDQYIGGAEHACMHLIYARFFTKALRDLKYVNFDEPFTKLFNQGMLHGDDGHVMSKSRGNVVLPEEVGDKYGIDTARFFLMSIASPDKDLEWSDQGIEGSARFMKRLFAYFDSVKIGKSSKKVESKLNKAIKGVTEDIEEFRYNLAIIKIRELFDALEEEVSKKTLENFLKLLHPFCPHFTEEFWEKIGNKPFITLAGWPKYDESKIDLKAEEIEKFIEGVVGDVRRVLKLVGNDKPEEIILFVSNEWKYKFMDKIKQEMEKTRNIGELIKKTMDKKHGKDISAMIPRLVKDPAKIPEIVLDQKTEVDALKKNLTILKKEFGTENIAVFTADESHEPKAKQAMPGKPAILIK
ncbi:MAG: leucine--tRNA ligase [Candidatus Woesearchaeota archaeon]